MAFKWTPTGEMRHQVFVQAKNHTVTKGSVTEGYSAPGTAIFAKIAPVRGQEFVLADQQRGTTTYVVNIRFFSGLTPDHRLNWQDKNKVLNIISVEDIGGIEREHRLMCREDT